MSESDGGIYDAWNKAISLSTGLWIGFLGADDFYLENAITNYVISINQLDELVDYISSNVELITFDKTNIKIMGSKWKWKQFKKYMKIAHVGSLHNRQYFEQYGLYDTRYKIAADYEMLLRKKENLKTLYIDTLTAKMRDGGVSNQRINLVFKETLHAKITTANRCKTLAKFEYYLSFLKFTLRKVFL